MSEHVIPGRVDAIVIGSGALGASTAFYLVKSGMSVALLGITAVTCGSSALNQVLERKTDRLMHRTQVRDKARPVAADTHA